MRDESNFVTAIALAFGVIFFASTAFAEPVRVAMPSKSLTFLNYYLAAEASLREIVKNFSKDGTTADEAVRGDIDFIREQNKLKAGIPLGQVVDYGILKEVLAEIKM
jgi:hypothetical protein